MNISFSLCLFSSEESKMFIVYIFKKNVLRYYLFIYAKTCKNKYDKW